MEDTNTSAKAELPIKATVAEPREAPKLSPFIQLVNSNDISGAEKMLLTGTASVHDTDSSGMTAFMHAAYKGHTEMTRMLIKQGSDVNADGHEHSYSPLHFAALSSNLDTTQLVLDAGARTYKINSVGRTAAQMAGFVGHSRCVALINNHVHRSELQVYTSPSAPHQTTTLHPSALEPLYRLIMQDNLHPVHLVLCVCSPKNTALIQHLSAAAAVLHTMSKKEAQRPSNVNEVLCLKFHYLAHLLDQLASEHNKHKETNENAENGATDDTAKKNTAENPEDGSPIGGPFHSLTKQLLRCRPSDGAELWLEKWVRDAVKSFHSLDMPLFLQVVRSLSGQDTQALSVLNGAINGNRGFAPEHACSTCGNDNEANKKCTGCKRTLYCNKICQKLHWTSHKKFCDKLKAVAPAAT